MDNNFSFPSFQDAVVEARSHLCAHCLTPIYVVPQITADGKMNGFGLFCSKCQDGLSSLAAQSNGSYDQSELAADKAAARFWRKVFIPLTATKEMDWMHCWNWTRSTDHSGYGWFRNRRVERSNRFAFMVSHVHEPLIQGLVVRHLCANPSCCNPLHLIQGTYQQNAYDTALIGHFNRIMDITKIFQLMAEHEHGAKIRELSEQFGIGEWQVSAIIRGYSWNSVTGLPRIRRKKPQPKGHGSHLAQTS
jgi:hypothetical protein